MKKTHEMKPHAIMMTIPYQGHLSPIMHLALKLASKGFKVTFINTEHAHHSITNSIANNHNNGHTEVSDNIDIFAEARESCGLDIHYRTVSDGFPLNYDRDSEEFFESFVNDFPNVLEKLIVEIIGESCEDSSYFSSVLVSDTIPGWAPKIAEKYGMVNVSFWTQPAVVFAATYFKDLLVENGHFPPKDGKKLCNIDYIPGVESISTKDLPSYFTEEASSENLSLVQKIVFTSFDEVKKADFILHNTVQELEPHALSILNQAQPTYSIGPTNFYKESQKTQVPKSIFSETDCTKWLENKPSRSVLYVSFGSVVSTDRHVIEEIARGLALSGVYFLWTTRSYIDGNGSSKGNGVILPSGFEDEVKDRGLLVPWCDQRAVLSHRAIGGFLTHCGWNSVLESMWFGVPMICYPVAYDQPTNRKLVVDDWKVGIDLFYDGEEIVGAKDVAKKIKEVMVFSGEGSEMRHKVDDVRKILHSALEGDGSSEANFNRFVADLKGKIHEKAGGMGKEYQ